MQLETPSPDEARRTVHQTHIFPPRGPGPSDVLPNAAQGLGDGDFCGGHLCSRCTSQELVRVLFIVLGGHDEEASGGLDGVGVDALDDLIFFGALGGRLRIGRNVAAARVEQTVEATGGSLSDVRPVDEDG